MPENNLPTTAPGTAVAVSDEMLALMAQDTAHAQTFEQKDLMTPHLKIVQSTSEYMKRGEPGFVPGAAEGHFIETLGLTLRDDVMLVIVHFEETFTEWKPNQGPLVKQWGRDRAGYDAAEGDFGTRKTQDGNDIVPSATYYALLLTNDGGSSMPVMIYLTGTQYKKARRLNTLLTTLELPGPDGMFAAPTYARTYKASAIRESNDQGSWMGWKFDIGPLTLTLPGGAGIYAKAKEFKTAVLKGIVKHTGPGRGTDEGDEGGTIARAVRREAAALGGRRELDDDLPF